MDNLKQIETQLARMTKVFMDGADPIVIFDLNRRVLDMNHEAERVFGWTRDELLGGTTRHLLPSEFHGLADEVAERLARGETVRNYETAVRTKSGSIVPILVTSFRLTDDVGSPVATAAIAKDITQLKRVNDRLSQRNRELREFANVLAHDLSAPLRTIQGFSDLILQDSKELSPNQREYIELIRQGVERMDRLISDLLDYARIERGEIPTTSIDFNSVLKAALDNLHAAIHKTGAVITSDSLPVANANRTQMVQLLQNLIGNAIKFHGDEPPRIHVRVELSGDEWKFSVADNGIGIDAPNVNKIFDVFYRLHSEEDVPGTGIGLATCKAIVERHGGRIWVSSQVGDGATFHFTIPASNTP